MASFPSPPPASLLRLQERVGCVRRGGHHSLPKYLRTVFLALGLQPRPWGQALTASITLVSLRQAGPGHREGRREEAGAWLTLLGGWAMQNSSRCLLIPPTAHPPGRNLAISQRLKSALRGEAEKLEAGRSPPRRPGWGWEQSLVFPPLAQIIQPPKSWTAPGPGWVRQAVACLTSWAGSSPWRQGRQEKIIKKLDRGGGSALGLSLPRLTSSHLPEHTIASHTQQLLDTHPGLPVGIELRYCPSNLQGTPCVAPSLWSRTQADCPTPRALCSHHPTSAHLSCLPLSLCPLSPYLSSVNRQAGTGRNPGAAHLEGVWWEEGV